MAQTFNNGESLAIIRTKLNGNADEIDTSLQDTDLGVTVQPYDADTTKNDVANTFTQRQQISNSDTTSHFSAGGNGCDFFLGDPDTAFRASYSIARDVDSSVSRAPVMQILNANSGDDQIALRLFNNGTGIGQLIDQNGEAIALSIDSEAVSKSAVSVFTTTDYTGTGDNANVIFALNKVGAGNTGTNLHLRNQGSGVNLYVDTNGSGYSAIFDGGNVGIGTLIPTQKLDVNGNINTSGTGNKISINSTSGSGFLEIDSPNSSFSYIRYKNDGATTWDTGVQGDTSYQIRENGTTPRLAVDVGGNVGINETAPDYKLDVNGSFGFTPGASVTPVDNGDVVFELTNNTTLTIKAKGSDGTVRSGTITLS